MFWLIIRILLLLVFLFSVLQLYLNPNIGYLTAVLVSFISFISIKDPIVQAVEKLNSPNQKDVDESIDALKAINSLTSKIELERAMFYHKNPIVRLKVAIAMAELNHKRALRGLLPHLPDPKAVDALKNIEKVDDKRLRNQLIEKLKNKEEATVMHELGRLGGTDATEYIRRQIRFMANQPEDAKISATIEAINLAGDMKDVEIIPDLVTMFRIILIKREEYNKWGSIANGYLQVSDELLTSIVKAMGNIGDPRSTEDLSVVALGRHLSRDSIQEEAIIALSKIGDKKSINVLIKCLNDALDEKIYDLTGDKYPINASLALKVIASFVLLKKTETIDVLIKALGVNDQSVRTEAEKALKEILSKEKVDELIALQPSVVHKYIGSGRMR
jgi:HEAT repeat protein